jgi:hypothetical protein
MHDQPIAPHASGRASDTEFVVLALLLDPDSPGPWTVDELARERCGSAS